MRPLSRVFVVLILVAGTCGSIVWLDGSEWRRGEALAEHHWKSGHPVLFTADDGSYIRCVNGIYFEDSFDRETALQVQHRFPGKDAFYDGYNSTISRLLKAKGPPAWSLRGHIPSHKELSLALTDAAMEKVPAFPAEITDSIVIVNGGTFSRWGRTASGTMISVEARHGGSIAVGQPGETVYVGRSKDDHKVVFIRIANRWVGAFYEDGRYLCSAHIGGT